MAIFFALLTFIGWGVGDIFVTIASRRRGNINTLFWGQILGLLLTSLYLPFVGIPSDLGMLLLSLVLNLFMAYGTLFYFKALEVGNASLAGTIGGSFLVLVVIISTIFFGERLSPLQVIGIISTTIGVILVSLNFQMMKRNKPGNIFSEKGVQYALLAMLTWGIYYAVIRIPAGKIGWFWGYYPANLFFLVIILMRKLDNNTMKVLKDKTALLSIVMFCLLITMAQFAYNLGVLHGFTSIVAPIAGSYPVLFVILTRIVFGEKLTRQQKLGILSSLTGVVLLSFSSV